MDAKWMAGALVYDTSDLGYSYPALLKEVVSLGDEYAPRGLRVREARPLVLRLHTPHNCVVRRPGFSRAYMWMEITQYLAGIYDNALLARYSPKAAEMNNAYGAYGPRIGDQLVEVEYELERDKDSRRCMVYVGRPEDLVYAKDLDMVCTVAWNFQLRKDKLEMTVFMRSWDLVWGLSYDVPAFVSVQLALAHALHVDAGIYTHVAANAHVYEQHWTVHPEGCAYRLSNVGSPLGMTATRASARHLLEWERSAPYGAVLDTSAAESLKAWKPALDTWAMFGEAKKNAA